MMKNAEYVKALGKAIRELRKERGYSLNDLFFESRVNRQAIMKAERGEIDLRLDTMLRICKGLDVDPSYLFRMAESKL